MSKTLRKLLAILMAAALVLSLSAAAFAADGEDPEPVTTTLTKVESAIGVTLHNGESSSANFDASAHSYTAVKIMDLYKVVDSTGADIVDSAGKVVYQYKLVLTDALAADPSAFTALLAGAGFKFDADTGEITLASGGAVTSQAGVNENTSDAAKLAALIADYVVDNSIPGTALNNVGTATELQCGYWVIYETNNSSAAGADGTVATKPILVDLRPTDANGDPVAQRDITLKDAKVQLTKTVDDPTVAFNDIITYTVSTNFPTYQINADERFEDGYPKFEISDTVYQALVILPSTDADYLLSVTVGGAAVAASVSEEIEGETVTTTNYTVETNASNTSIKVSFTPAFILAHQGESIVLQYHAKLTAENAPRVDDPYGNPNTVTVTYSNNPENNQQVLTLTDSTKVFTFGFDLIKVDGTNDSALAGAKFQLKNSDDKGLVLTDLGGGSYAFSSLAEGETGATDIVIPESGVVTIFGLDVGVYTLTETEAPEGYTKVGDITITVEAETVSATDDTLTGNAKISVAGGSLLNSDTWTSGTKYTATLSTTLVTASGSNGGNVAVFVRNYKGIVLPETGSVTSIIVMAVGALIVLGGGAFLLFGKKRSEE